MPIEQTNQQLIIARPAEDPVLANDLTALLAITPACDVIVDFASVEYVNSANLSQLLRLRQHLHDKDRKLTLRHIQPLVWKAFTITGLDHVFKVE